MRARTVNTAPSNAHILRHGVELLHIGATLLGANRVVIATAEVIELAFAQASRDPGEQHSSDRADGGCVVFAVFHHEAVVARGQGGITVAGLISRQQERFPQAGIALLGRSADGVDHPGAVLPGHQT